VSALIGDESLSTPEIAMSITVEASPSKIQNKKKYQYSERLARPLNVTKLLKETEIASPNPRAGAPT